MVGRGLRFGGWGGVEGFGVLRKVFCAIGRVEAFREDDDFGAESGRFEDFGAGVSEVVRFVGCGGELHQREFDGLFEELRHVGSCRGCN